jgi:hypothetical protein
LRAEEVTGRAKGVHVPKQTAARADRGWVRVLVMAGCGRAGMSRALRAGVRMCSRVEVRAL